MWQCSYTECPPGCTACCTHVGRCCLTPSARGSLGLLYSLSTRRRASSSVLMVDRMWQVMISSPTEDDYLFLCHVYPFIVHTAHHCNTSSTDPWKSCLECEVLSHFPVFRTAVRCPSSSNMSSLIKCRTGTRGDPLSLSLAAEIVHVLQHILIHPSGAHIGFMISYS